MTRHRTLGVTVASRSWEGRIKQSSSADQKPSEAALARAQKLCDSRGLRLTDLRRRALEALANAGAPVKAYDLLPALGSGQAPAKPATAYRTLDFLQSIGLVHKVAGLNAYVLCAHEGGAHATALFICDVCGRTEEHTRCDDTSRTPPGTPPGFAVSHSVIEHYGRCRSCAE